MRSTNPLITTFEEQFVVGESDFAFFDSTSCRIEGAAVLLCHNGQALFTIDGRSGNVIRNTMMLILPGMMLSIENRSEDFSASFCAFSRDLFSEAAFRIDPSFFQTIVNRPFAYPPTRIVEGASIWFQMAAYTYRDRNNMFRNTIIKNRLQNVLLEIWDKTQRFAARQSREPENTTRQTEIFRKYVALIHENCTHEREVQYYAGRLCISTRYLSTISRAVSHHSAKELIDHSVMLEIKTLLSSTDLSVQEIAYRLHFPDQSYLGRFFKKHTGESPTEYRNGRK